MKVDVYKIPQSAPDDLTGLKELDPTTIVAILGKTEGNGCVNDFTRGFAIQAIQAYLRSRNVNPDPIMFCMSGGTEGVISPHLTVFCKQEQVEEDASQQRFGLVLGVHHTESIPREQVGTLAMVQVVAQGVEKAMESAGLLKEDVHFVQIKCPLVPNSNDSYKSMATSRGASALGVAVALGEIPENAIEEHDICQNWDKYSSVASASAGVELQNCEILVLGNSSSSHSDCIIQHSVMQHALDTDAIQEALGDYVAPDDVINVLAKAEAHPKGVCLGRRNTMLEDSDIPHTRMARAVVGATIASIVRDPMIYVSGGAEHQGPPGGGPIAVICRTRSSQ